MTVIVEDGTGLADANSYVSEDEADTYADDRGITAWSDSAADKEAALVRATTTLDATYRNRFSGSRLNGRAQALEWPRLNSYDYLGNLLDDDEVPIEVRDATIELAFRELADPGSTMPDLDRTIRSLKAGSVSIEYASNAAAKTSFSIISAIMSSLVGSGTATSLVGESVRG